MTSLNNDLAKKVTAIYYHILPILKETNSIIQAKKNVSLRDWHPTSLSIKFLLKFAQSIEFTGVYGELI